MSLQYCCNAGFAREVRSILQAQLQTVQVTTARLSDGYALYHPQVRHNPLFLPFADFQYLCSLFDKHQHCVFSFCKVFMAKYCVKEGKPLMAQADRYIVNDARRAVEADRRLERITLNVIHNGIGFTHVREAFTGCEFHLQTGEPQKFDFAYVRYLEGSAYKQILLGRRNGDHHFLYTRGMESQAQPYAERGPGNMF